MMKVGIASLWPLAIVMILCFSCNSSNPRFEISVKEIVRCQDSGTDEVSFSSTRLTKVGRYTYDYITNYTLSITLDDSLSILTELQAWGNGGWRPGFFTHDSPHFCSGLKLINPQWFQELIKNTGKDDCPIPPGTYEVTAYNFSFAEFNVPMWEFGKYRVMNQFYKADTLVGCIGMVVDATPKRWRSKKKN